MPADNTNYKPWERLIAAPIALAIANLLFGAYAVISKIAFSQGVDFIVYAFLRDAFATPILLMAAYLIERLPFPKPEDRFHFALLGLLSYGNQMFFLLGVKFTSPINSSLIQLCIPIFTAILSAILGMESLSPKNKYGLTKIVGIILAVAGASMVITLGGTASTAKPNPDENVYVGAAFLVTNCLCMAGFIVRSRKIMQKYPPVTVTAYSYLGTLIGMSLSLLPVSIDVSRWNIPTNTWWALMYASVIHSALAFGLVSYGNSRSGPVMATAFFTCQVVSSAVLSFIILDAQLNGFDGGGAAMIITGVLLVVFAKKKEASQIEYQPIATSLEENEETAAKREA